MPTVFFEYLILPVLFAQQMISRCQNPFEGHRVLDNTPYCLEEKRPIPKGPHESGQLTFILLIHERDC
ncbi:hypothetical protein ES703_88370 [subsurface metagenome]